MPHLVAAFDHDTEVVLGQLAVADKSNEIPYVRDLLAGFDLALYRQLRSLSWKGIPVYSATETGHRPWAF